MSRPKSALKEAAHFTSTEILYPYSYNNKKKRNKDSLSTYSRSFDDPSLCRTSTCV
jgi:hypothetical protein